VIISTIRGLAAMAKTVGVVGTDCIIIPARTLVHIPTITTDNNRCWSIRSCGGEESS
jgi:hypothetical protein